jgi:hypothetical protein
MPNYYNTHINIYDQYPAIYFRGFTCQMIAEIALWIKLLPSNETTKYRSLLHYATRLSSPSNTDKNVEHCTKECYM